MSPIPGDLLRLPMGIAHGFFNKADQPVKCLFWVTPTRKLYDLFWAIHSMKEQKPDEVVALSAKHEVLFLPPPPACWAEGAAGNDRNRGDIVTPPCRPSG